MQYFFSDTNESFPAFEPEHDPAVAEAGTIGRNCTRQDNIVSIEKNDRLMRLDDCLQLRTIGTNIFETP